MSTIHLTQSGSAVTIQTRYIIPENSMERLASWLRSDETPLIYKIGAIALSLIFGYGIGALIGYPLLGAAISFLHWAYIAWNGLHTLSAREQQVAEEVSRIAERNRGLAPHVIVERLLQEGTLFRRSLPHEILAERQLFPDPVRNPRNIAFERMQQERDALLIRRPPQETVADARIRLMQETAAALTHIKNAVGGEEAFNVLPELDIGYEIGSTHFLDFIRASDLSHSVMRGIDALGRSFISLKLRLIAPLVSQEPFVVTLFQRRVLDGMWCWGFCAERMHQGNEHALFHNPLGPTDLAAIHQIVVERNHPVLSLV